MALSKSSTRQAARKSLSVGSHILTPAGNPAEVLALLPGGKLRVRTVDCVSEILACGCTVVDALSSAEAHQLCAAAAARPNSIPVSEIPASELGLENWGTADASALEYGALGALRFLLQNLADAGVEIPARSRVLRGSIGNAKAILELYAKRQAAGAAKIDARRAGGAS